MEETAKSLEIACTIYDCVSESCSYKRKLVMILMLLLRRTFTIIDL